MKQLLRKCGLTIDELATEARMSKVRIQQIIEKKAHPGAAELAKISKAVGLPAEEVKDYLAR